MNQTGPRLVGAALVVLVGIWAGFRVYSSRAQHAHGVPVAAGEASAPTPGDYAPEESAIPRPTIPERLPAFSLNDLNGKSTPISVWAGKSLMINFWATWCAPCRQEIPLLKTLASDWAGRGLEVVGIAIDHRDMVLQFAGQFKIDYPLLIGEQDALDVAAKFGMESPVFPFTVFTDKRGQVVTLFVGQMHRPQADLILSVVQQLNQDKVQLAGARNAIAEGLAALAAKTG
jgi:thiol-disulfide isomerase/thioredoxin